MIAVVAGSLGVEADEPPAFTELEISRILRHSPLRDPPPDPTNPLQADPRAARLGQYLFFDKRLSSNGKISCATCHDPSRSFTDGKPVFEALGRGARNTPALWNVAHNRWFFWDGRADSLWAQAAVPIEHPDEMGFSRVDLARLVSSDAELRSAYHALFGAPPDVSDVRRFPRGARPMPAGLRRAADPPDAAWRAMSGDDRAAVNRLFTNLTRAIAAYQRRIVSRRAPFDVFVEGLRENDAVRRAELTPAAQRGLRLFIGRGECRLCHSGPLFSDGEFHNIGVPSAPSSGADDPGRHRGIDLLLADEFNAAGHYAVPTTGPAPARFGAVLETNRDSPASQRLHHLRRKPDDWGAFKTPSLRNVARTAPYMHQGQFAALSDVLRYYSTLEGAVRHGHHQESLLVPLRLTPEETSDLIHFLEALTDESLDSSLLRPPPSPIPAASR